MAFLKEVACGGCLDLSHYADNDAPHYEKLIKQQDALNNVRVIHINATDAGGGVAEMLKSQVCLERSLGIDSRWFAIADAPPSFFKTTKKIHNLLQGKQGELEPDEKAVYHSINKELADSLEVILKDVPHGIVVVHDPQPAPLIQAIPHRFKKFFRLHIDISTPDDTALHFLEPHLRHYDGVIISNAEYRTSLPWVTDDRIHIIMPAIDPLIEKNMPMDETKAHTILEQFGIAPTKPLITQVSRFDPWKDPIGVIEAYYHAQKEIPDLQLALAGLIIADDDPEAATIFERVKKHTKGDPHIFLFADPRLLRTLSNDTFINALYTASDGILQKSIREGFGLTITEAMWKRKPVIAGNTVGARAQIKDGKNGFIVPSAKKAGETIVMVIGDEKLQKKIGKAAHTSVQKNFLLPRYILDHVTLYLR